MEKKIQLLLVDDHSLFRESLGRLLAAEEDLELAGDFSSVAEAVAALDHIEADVILLDFDLGEQQGLELIQAVAKKGDPVRILMVTAGMSDADTLRALKSGAAGIFLKHSPPSELIAAIHKVHRGEQWLDSGAIRSLVAAADSGREKPQVSPAFSERELAVLKGVFEGLTNKEIAAKLDISEGYVKAVLQQLFQKTGVRNRSQLVRIALEHQRQYGLHLEER